MPARKWNELPGKAIVERTVSALTANGFGVTVVATGREARETVLGLIPEGAQVMAMSSQTLEAAGIRAQIDESGRYDSVRKALNGMDRAAQNRRMQELGAAPEWAVGSAHALTQDGHLMIASMTGSQLAAEASGADHVVYVVGTHKIVKDVAEGMTRINEYVLPLESERARKAYGVPGSAVNKILLVNAERLPWPTAPRSHVVLVEEALGF